MKQIEVSHHESDISAQGEKAMIPPEFRHRPFQKFLTSAHFLRRDKPNIQADVVSCGPRRSSLPFVNELRLTRCEWRSEGKEQPSNGVDKICCTSGSPMQGYPVMRPCGTPIAYPSSFA